MDLCVRTYPPPFQNAVRTAWTPVCEMDIIDFLALTIHMGMVRLPEIKDYWSTDPLFSFPYFATRMSRDRYMMIRSHLHLADNTQIVRADKLYKVRPAIVMLNESFRLAIVPGEHVALDEATIPTRARHSLKQYNPDKPHKYGFKMFKLCDHSSFLMWFMLYQGKANHFIEPAGLPTTIVRAATEVLERFLNYRLYMDSWYTSVAISEELLLQGIYLIGTVAKRRIGLPRAVVQARLKNRGDVKAAMKVVPEGALTAFQWRDTKCFLALSTAHDTQMVQVRRRLRGQAEPADVNCPAAI